MKKDIDPLLVYLMSKGVEITEETVTEKERGRLEAYTDVLVWLEENGYLDEQDEDDEWNEKLKDYKGGF